VHCTALSGCAWQTSVKLRTFQLRNFKINLRKFQESAFHQLSAWRIDRCPADDLAHLAGLLKPADASGPAHIAVQPHYFVRSLASAPAISSRKQTCRHPLDYAQSLAACQGSDRNNAAAQRICAGPDAVAGWQASEMGRSSAGQRSMPPSRKADEKLIPGTSEG